MNWLFGHLLGILIALGFPPSGIWPLTWFAGILVFRFFLDRNLKAKDYAQFFFSFVFSVQLWGFYWLAYTLKEFGGLAWPVSIFVVIALFAAGAGIAALFAWLWPRLRDRFSSRYSIPLLAVYLSLWELVDFRLFPWTWAQSVGSNETLLASVHYLKTAGWNLIFLAFCSLGAYFLSLPDIRRRSLALSSLILLTFGSTFGLGIVARKKLNEKFSDRQPVALLQGNVGNYDKKMAKTGDYPTIENVLAIHRDIVETAAIFFRSEYELKGREPWVIWPETSFPGSPLSNARHQEVMKNFALLTGGLHIVGTYEKGTTPVGDQNLNVDFNIAAFFHESHGFLARYRKIVRVPFGEYVPGDHFYPEIYEAIPSLVHFGAGDSYVGFAHPDPSGPVFVPLVCYEILFNGLVDDFVQEVRKRYPGREVVLVNLTNDSWYGPTSEPFTHSLLSRWAAVRQGLPLLRPTNTGISQIIAPWGEVLGTGPRNSTWVVLGEVPVEKAFRKEANVAE